VSLTIEEHLKKKRLEIERCSVLLRTQVVPAVKWLTINLPRIEARFSDLVRAIEKRKEIESRSFMGLYMRSEIKEFRRQENAIRKPIRERIAEYDDRYKFSLEIRRYGWLTHLFLSTDHECNRAVVNLRHELSERSKEWAALSEKISSLRIECEDLEQRKIKKKKRIKEEERRRKARERKDQERRDAYVELTGRTRKVASTIRRRLEDDHPCPYCGGDLGDDCCADHIYPVGRGGRSTAENMVMICRKCNQRKTDLTLVQFVRKADLDFNEVSARLDALGKEH